MNNNTINQFIRNWIKISSDITVPEVANRIVIQIYI